MSAARLFRVSKEQGAIKVSKEQGAIKVSKEQGARSSELRKRRNL